MRRSALALLLGCLLLVAGASALDGYDYYQTIEYAACDQEIYQQDIVIHRSTGTAYNETAGGLETWHIFVGDHCQADYDDVRFTNSTGDLAYYLWPDYDSSSARFAVRLEGADSAGEVKVWYGNPTATTTSDGDGAYLLHDHFEGSALNSLKWEVLKNNGISVSDGALHISSGTTNDGALASLAQIQSDILIQFRIQTRTYGTSLGVGNTDLSGVGSSIGLVYYTGYESAIYTGPIYEGNRWTPPRTWTASSTDGDVITAPPAGYFVEEFAIPEGGYLKQRRNGGAWTTSTRYTGVSGSHPIQITHYRGYAGMDLDYILVRAYSATPPAATTFSGEQETTSPPTTSFTATPTAGLAPLTVQFTDRSAGGPTSWSWTFGDGGTSTDQNPQHTYTTPGTYTVNLTATNEYGSDYELKTDYITVYGPITAQFSATPTGGTAPLTVQFTDLSTGGPTSWLWDFGDGNTSTDQNPTHTYTTAGTHTVALTASHPYDSDTETKPAYITVAVLQPFPGLANIPRDLAGNGLYTDINGNGRLDYNDLTVFFQNLAWAKTAQPIACFDFNGNGWLDYNDVITLFMTISGGV